VHHYQGVVRLLFRVVRVFRGKQLLNSSFERFELFSGKCFIMRELLSRFDFCFLPAPPAQLVLFFQSSGFLLWTPSIPLPDGSLTAS
jgi:hypothetical protein